MRLLLVRHPAPEVAVGTCYGRLDVPLRGDTHAAITAIAESARAHRVRTVWSSPAARCLVPARATADLARARLRVEPKLRELDFGAWEGLRWDDVPRAALDHWAADPSGFAPPDGESGRALVQRVGEVWDALVAEAADCAVISHGGPLRILRALADGTTPDLLAAPPPFGAVIALTLDVGSRGWPGAGAGQR